MVSPRIFRVLVSVTAVCSLTNAACDDGSLTTVEAGLVVDAGSSRDAGLHPPRPDAGEEFDAGIPNGGLLPSGLPISPTDWVCQIPDVEEADVDTACEPDADFCDDAYDTVYGVTDILAEWSYLDGDEFVVQVLFRRALLREFPLVFGQATEADIGIIFADGPFSCRGSNFPGVPSMHDPWSSVVIADEFELYLNEYDLAYSALPPDRLFWFSASSSTPQPDAGCDQRIDLDPCMNLRLHPSLPLYEVRIDRALVSGDGPIRYRVRSSYHADRDAEESPAVDSRLWVETKGGKHDLTDELVSVCDLSCVDE